jgi:putative ABC transport system permease protein
VKSGLRFGPPPVRISFLSDQPAALYEQEPRFTEQERRFTALAGALAGLAMLLAGLGLAGLVAYLTRLRTKEIGIRKALGGSAASIVALLNKEYVQLVGVAFLVDTPLAWWAAGAWLDQFACRVGLSDGRRIDGNGPSVERTRSPRLKHRLRTFTHWSIAPGAASLDG